MYGSRFIVCCLIVIRFVCFVLFYVLATSFMFFVILCLFPFLVCFAF
jgi:hypothetical protein